MPIAYLVRTIVAPFLQQLQPHSISVAVTTFLPRQTTIR